jgi:predicted GH43/DUF377 family glycosyl hydrolase
MKDSSPLSWQKYGLVFKPAEYTGQSPNRPWLSQFAQGPSTLIFDDFVRVYFSCRPLPDVNGQYVSYSSYVDLDRHNLTKIIAVANEPILALGARGCFDEFGVYPVSVIRHHEKILAYYGGWTRCVSVPFNVSIGCAISLDNGNSFERMGTGPILPYSPDEPFILSGPKIRKFGDIFFLYYIAGSEWISHAGKAEPIYRIRLAISDDGLNWKKLNRDLISVRIEDKECQASPDVIYHNGMYHMFFCYRKSVNYRGREGGYRIGYAHSVNGMDWVRNDDHAGIGISSEGWDSEMVAYPHVFECDGSVYMFYLGNAVGRDGFGMAKLNGILR